ncbi:hypothetical protein BDF22DRAFT_745929 [Syncephalis plumigaleata]|nr:hypothetical protein BDF22DRAFT_745929 [Syncephalis plumigaleata]
MESTELPIQTDKESRSNAIELLLSTQLPASVNRQWLLTLQPRDVSRLMCTSRNCYNSIANDFILWRTLYSRSFFDNNIDTSHGENIDYKEEEWLEWSYRRISKAASRFASSAASSIQASPTPWMLLYSERMRAEQRWSTGSIVDCHVELARLAALTNGKSKSRPSTHILATGANGCLVLVGEQLWWVALQQDSRVEMTRLHKRAISPNHSAARKDDDNDTNDEPTKLANITFVSIAAEWIVIVEKPPPPQRLVKNQLVIWSLPRQQEQQQQKEKEEGKEEEMNEEYSVVYPHRQIKLEAKDTAVQVIGPWLLLDRFQGVQGGSIPLLCYLPTGNIIVEAQRKPGISNRVIQTFSDSLVCSTVERVERTRKQHGPPSAVVLSVFVHREISEIEEDISLTKDYLHWELTKYSIPNDSVESSGSGADIVVCNSGRLTENRINSKSVWLERVDHQRVLVRYRLLGPASPLIVLVRSTNIIANTNENDEPTNTSVIWQMSKDPAAMHACASQNILLLVLRTNDLQVVGLDTGDCLYSVDCLRQSYGEACLGARILRIQPASRHDTNGGSSNSSDKRRRGQLEIMALDNGAQTFQLHSLAVQPSESRSMDMAKSLGELFRPVKLQFSQLRMSSTCMAWIDKPAKKQYSNVADKPTDSIVMTTFY